MSAAREVGGVRGTAGRKGERKEQRNWLSKAEQEALRTGFHDFLRARGERVQRVAKPQFGRGLGAAGGGVKKVAGEVQRTRQESSEGELAPGWEERFLRSYLRSGDLRSAAALCGVKESSVRAALGRDGAFRERCAEALEGHSWRMLLRCARVKGSRLVLSQRTAGAVVRYVERVLARGSVVEEDGGGTV